MTDIPSQSATRTRRTAALVLSSIALAGLAACADGAAPLAPLAPDAPSLGREKAVTTSTTYSSDTTFTKITIRPKMPTWEIWIGNGNSIQFPNGASSVCDLASSSYGPGTWDAPCTPSLVPVTIYAKTWTDTNGLAHSDFQPAMRFVPSDVVQLEMRNKNGLITTGMRIDFCTSFGCVNEAAADPSVATTLDRRGGTAYRRIKHFSGYMVTVGLTDEPTDAPDAGENW